MAKKESTFLTMTISLLVITLVAGLSLGFINDVTKGPKAAAKLARKVNALKQVLPEFDNDVVNEVKRIQLENVKDSTEIYVATLQGQEAGTAIVGSSEKGFSGLIKIMVGFNPDGTIKNISVLEQKETPGLGTKIKDDKYLQQYRGKNPSTFNMKAKKDGGEIDALTGATITTRAFSEAAQQAYDVFINEKN